MRGQLLRLKWMQALKDKSDKYAEEVFLWSLPGEPRSCFSTMHAVHKQTKLFNLCTSALHREANRTVVKV